MLSFLYIRIYPFTIYHQCGIFDIEWNVDIQNPLVIKNMTVIFCQNNTMGMNVTMHFNIC